jgi:hypothetical protein
MEQKLIQNALVAQHWLVPAFFIGVSLNKQRPSLPTPYVHTHGNKNQLFFACARPNVTNKSGLQREVDLQRSDFHLEECKPM